MALSSGSRIGPYEILELLGAGGMGEVYRARDSKLKRDVAIKVLLSEFAGDTERLARFHREAEVLALRWQRDGKAVYFIAPDNRLTQVPLRFAAGRTPEPGLEAPLFTTHVGITEQQLDLAQYAVSPDGKRFLMNAVTQEAHLSPITLVLNWKPH